MGNHPIALSRVKVSTIAIDLDRRLPMSGSDEDGASLHIGRFVDSNDKTTYPDHMIGQNLNLFPQSSNGNMIIRLLIGHNLKTCDIVTMIPYGYVGWDR
ncbi:MAG TPA: hypothetical protein VGZ00_01950 [Candidatus Baltobacteraceae bacterium]|nr:hypothetical protein [Candidatus Baltobacteraceae bacterium]